MAIIFHLTLFSCSKKCCFIKTRKFHRNFIYFGDNFTGKIFSGPEGVSEWMLSLLFISRRLSESLIFVSYWSKNKFQSLEMFSKMELLFSSQPYSVCFSFYVLAVLIFRSFGFQAYLHFYGSLITNTSPYLIISLVFFFFFKLHFFQTN